MDDVIDFVFDEDDSDSSFDLNTDDESSVEESGNDFVHLNTAPGIPCFRDSILDNEVSSVFLFCLFLLYFLYVRGSNFFLCQSSESGLYT